MTWILSGNASLHLAKWHPESGPLARRNICQNSCLKVLHIAPGQKSEVSKNSGEKIALIDVNERKAKVIELHHAQRLPVRKPDITDHIASGSR